MTLINVPQLYIRPLLFWLVLSSLQVTAQRNIPATDTIFIKGKIKGSKFYTLSDLDTFKKVIIKDQIIFNHKGEVKDTIKNMKGIPLKALLKPIEFIYEKPKELNAYYFVMIGSDGYKVVLSWNEIYNTTAGDNFFIITEMNGKALKELEQRILFISTADLQSGRRYIKGLKTIEVCRVE